MDITDALAPSSDQLDAVELVNPRTFTIAAGSRIGERDGKKVAEIRLVDFPRVWRPSKGMLDVLARCWGTDGKLWVGRSVTLFNDPDVMFGRDKVGGIRISHLSHIDGPVTVPIRAPGKGARKIQWPIKPLETPPANLPNPNAAILGEIGALADQLPGGRAQVAKEWADAHNDESLRNATDTTALQQLRDNLTDRLAAI